MTVNYTHTITYPIALLSLFLPSYFQIAMALKVMEGVALSLNDDLELISKCTPLVVKARALRALGVKQFPPPGINTPCQYTLSIHPCQYTLSIYPVNTL